MKAHRTVMQKLNNSMVFIFFLILTKCLFAQITPASSFERDSIAVLKGKIYDSITELSSLQNNWNLQMKQGEMDIKKLKNNEPLILKMKSLEKRIDSLLNNMKSCSSVENYVQFLDVYIQEFPNSIFLLLERAKLSEDEKAGGICKRIIYINPVISEAHLFLAGLLEKQGKYDEALLEYKRVLTIDASNDNAYKNIFELSFKLQMQNELCDFLLTLYKHDANNRELTERLVEALQKSNRQEEAKRITKKLTGEDK